MSRGTILVVDDDPEIVSIVTEALQKDGYQVLVATSETLLQVARQVQPDLILLDVMMPHPDGGALSLTLHALQETAEIPLVLMSASPALNTLSTVLPVAAQLSKPFDLADLSTTVAQWVAVRHEQLAASTEAQPGHDDPLSGAPRVPISARQNPRTSTSLDSAG